MMKNRGFTLDTNIVTAFMAKDERVLARMREASEAGLEVTMNAISYYEIRRGLESAGRLDKVAAFERICGQTPLLLIDERRILDEASGIWARLKQSGAPIPDADVLIASIAMTKGYRVVSNDAHFERIQGLSLDNWLR